MYTMDGGEKGGGRGREWHAISTSHEQLHIDMHVALRRGAPTTVGRVEGEGEGCGALTSYRKVDLARSSKFETHSAAGIIAKRNC